MVVLIAWAAVLIVLIYFITQRRVDGAWERYRERQKERRRHPRPNEPIDPNFDFSQSPPAPEERDPGNLS